MSQDMVQHYLPPAIQKTIDYYFYQFSKSNMCYNHQMTSTVFPNSLTFYKPMNELFIGKSHRQISQYWKIFIICRAVSAKAITQLITCWSTEINRQPFYSVKSVKIKTLKKKFETKSSAEDLLTPYAILTECYGVLQIQSIYVIICFK